MSKPSDAREIATALPIPRLAPVMTATGFLFIKEEFYQFRLSGNMAIKVVILF
jgi:hypothetical protein